ncbi:MAG: hypothetical protein HC840_07345 [Leptolyngbyaceae cyanobacterium RM2_2_4]|nr:hypothetical protein [Leptolyngbyaceae cyanobacterium RM2_2_4]
MNSKNGCHEFKKRVHEFKERVRKFKERVHEFKRHPRYQASPGNASREALPPALYEAEPHCRHLQVEPGDEGDGKVGVVQVEGGAIAPILHPSKVKN